MELVLSENINLIGRKARVGGRKSDSTPRILHTGLAAEVKCRTAGLDK